MAFPRSMKRDYYSDSIANFLKASRHEIFGQLNEAHHLSSEPTQKGAWLEEIDILKNLLFDRIGKIYFEYAIPRMGKRIDVVLLIGPVIFVLEFKIGESWFTSYALDQVCDYALDLKNFHESSHNQFIVPVLIASDARVAPEIRCTTPQGDKVLSPIRCNLSSLGPAVDEILRFVEGNPDIDPEIWESGRYCPTPTIIEAALALYKGHSVEDITRHEADKPDITLTSDTIDNIIRASRDGSYKSICFVTGVPGAGPPIRWRSAWTGCQRSLPLQGRRPMAPSRRTG